MKIIKKKVVILGSTGSIGKTTIDIIRKNKKEFDIILFTSNKNFKVLLNQAKEFNVKNLLITDKKKFNYLQNKLNNKKIRIFNKFEDFSKHLNNKKIDYTMCAISGLSGLKPTLEAIKFSKLVAIANKESLICAWDIIKKKLKKYNTKFIPVDSEHFSIWSILNTSKNLGIEEIIITASGGPFLNYNLKKLKNVKPNKAVKHPNWKMGKKISVDSATLMNKVFEIIEAQRIFKVDINKFQILIHPKSYIHSIVKLINGQIKILAHDTNMKIPIFNSIYQKQSKKLFTKKINVNLLNNLELRDINKNKFPSIKILKSISNNNTLYETVLISANDELVDLYIKNKIRFLDINKILVKILKLKKYSIMNRKKPKKISDIINLSEEVRLKTRNLCIELIKKWK